MEATPMTVNQVVLGRQILGSEDGAIDDKGRVRVSKKQQVALGYEFVLAVLSVGCLAAYPLDVWNQRIAEILSKPASSPDRESALRELGALAEDGIRCDPQGRFVIPYRLREATGLERGEIILVGCIDHLEIWSKAAYGEYRKDPEAYAGKRREYMQRIWDRLMSF